MPWRELGGDPIVVLLTKPALDEIDKHKKATARTRTRAIEVFNRVRDLLKSGNTDAVVREASPRVILRLMANVPPDEVLRGSLDYSKNDDRLIGILSTLTQESNGETTELLTHDTGPASTASGLGLPFRLIEDNWKRPAAETTEVKHIKQLEKDLATYRSREPVISIRHDADIDIGSVEVVRRLASPLTEEEIENVIEMLRAKHRVKEVFAPPAEPNFKLGFLKLNDDATFDPPSDNDIKRYQKDAYPQWLQRCREILSDIHKDRNEPEERVILRWSMANEGNRPASQVRIQFEAQGPLALLRLETINEDDNDEEMCTNWSPKPVPNLPSPPTPPAFKKVVKRISGSDGNMGASHGTATRSLLGLSKNGLSDMAKAVDQFRALQGISGGSHSNLDNLTGVTRIFDEHNMKAGIGGLPQSWDAGRLSLPSLGPLISRPITALNNDPEAFYFDDWDTIVPVKKGALTCDLWRHKGSEECFEFEVVFDGDKEVRGAVLCTVHAENLTEPAALHITVSRTVERFTLLDVAGQMVANCN